MRGFWQTKRSRYLEGTFNEQSSFIPKHYLASTADADTVRFNFMITSFGVKTTNICRISETLERLYEIDYQTSDRKSTRLNSSHMSISYAVFCLKKKKK